MPQTPEERQARLRAKNRRVMTIALSMVFAMVGVSFAAVPLYNLFCAVTGFGGTTQTADDLGQEVIDRTVAVRFTADADQALPWDFEVETREVEVRLGEPRLVYYSARNNSDEPVAATAVYNVSPGRTGIYFYKVQCFCFDEQILMPGEEVDFPVYFYVDAAMDNDRAMDDIRSITLSYTFFPTESEALDRAIEDYYRSVEEANQPTAALDSGPADTVTN
ncbi:MAG: cytochrome c oxidase assembly protein [Azospirillaceae bacterium]